MSSDVITTIYATLAGTISGAIIGAIGSIFATRELFKRERHKVFIEAFAPVLAALEDSTDETPGFTYDIIKAAYPTCFNAYIAYRSILSKDEREALTRKWDHYCEVQDEHNVMIPKEKKFYRFAKYIADMDKRDEEKPKRLLAIRDIESLIETH